MKLIITEKQLSKIIGKKKQVDETDDTTSSSSTTSSPSSASGTDGSSSTTSSDTNGTSPGAADYPPYPETGKWTSGVKRGAANQIDDKSNWHDVVGSTISRGKANPLNATS